MTLGNFLAEEVDINFRRLDLSALDKLAGKKVGEISFYGDIEQAFGKSGEPYTSPFFFPIGYYLDWEVGFHLHPRYLNWESLVIAHNDHSMIQDKSPMLVDYVFQHLLDQESRLYEDGDYTADADEFVESVSIANDAFGAGFYAIGRFGVHYPGTFGFDNFKPTPAVSMDTAAKSVFYRVGSGKRAIAALECGTALKAYR